MLSAIVTTITIYETFSFTFCLYRVKTWGFARVQMIKKPQRQFKKTEESQGQKARWQGKVSLLFSQPITSTWYPSNYSLSSPSFPCHPSTIKLYSGTTEISVAGLSSWRMKLFVPEHTATQIFHVGKSQVGEARREISPHLWVGGRI